MLNQPRKKSDKK